MQFSTQIEEYRRKAAAFENDAIFLQRLLSKAQQFPHAVKESDKLTEKTRLKLKMLDALISILGNGDNYLYGGAPVQRIYEAMMALGDENPLLLGNDDNAEKKFVRKTANSKLRSHLTVCGREGRIFHDPSSSKWRITPSANPLLEQEGNDPLMH